MRSNALAMLLHEPAANKARELKASGRFCG
jgi:hypothetical protein